jgi:hypothetical protein
MSASTTSNRQLMPGQPLPATMLKFQTRVETWTGTIDSIDTRPASSRRYNRYVLSGHFVSSIVVATEAETAEQAAELMEAEAVEKDRQNRRVILRDHDRLPLVHVGAIVKLVLQTRPPNDRFDIPEFDVLYCIFLRSPHAINKVFLSKALCSPIALCMARKELLNAADRKAATKIRDVPTPAESTPIVTDLMTRNHFNLSMLRRDDKPELTRQIMVAFESLFGLSAIGIGTRVTEALRRATARPISMSSFVVHSASPEDLSMLCNGLLRADNLQRVFACITPETVDVRVLPLHCRIWQRPVFTGSTQIIRSSDAFDHFHTTIPPKNYASGSMAGELSRMIKQLGSGQSFNKVEARVKSHTSVCIAALRFGHTKFNCLDLKLADEMLRLRVWVLADEELPAKITDKTPIPFTAKTMLTTQACKERKSQIVAALEQYVHVGLVSIDGGYAELSGPDYKSIVQPGSFVVAPNAAGVEFGEYHDKKIHSLDGVFEGRSWSMRAHAGIAPSMVILDAHFIGERDLLLLLQIYRRLQIALAPMAKSKVVLVGDRCQYPASGGGCPFTDLYSSGSFATVECYAPNPPEVLDQKKVSIQRMAALARYSPEMSIQFANEFITRRVERARDIMSSIDDMKQPRPWIVIANGAFAMREFIHSLYVLVRERTATNDRERLKSKGDQKSRRLAIIDALEFVSKNPVALSSSILVFAPFILYEGYIIRVVTAFQQTRVERPESPLELEDCVLISPYRHGLISLDARALVLRLENSPVDHRICCGTKFSNVMRVAVHRRAIHGASMMMARDAASRVGLANDVFLSCAHPRNLSPLTWNDVCAVIPRFLGDVQVLVPKAMGNSDDIFVALHSVCRRIKTAPRTLFQDRRHLHDIIDLN